MPSNGVREESGTEPDSSGREVSAGGLSKQRFWTECKSRTGRLTAVRRAILISARIESRGVAYQITGQYERAIADYNEAIRINPVYSGAYASLAQLQATCPDDRYRDGKKALQNAKQACEQSGWKTGDALDSLAAAYAETGDFEKARQYEAKAIELVNTERMKNKYRSRLELYKANKPFRIKPADK
jgi:tetratricopeptide (TPR) repeat protein